MCSTNSKSAQRPAKTRCADPLSSSNSSAGYAYLVLGLAARHPCLVWLRRRFRAREYPSLLYTVHWDEGQETILDDRLPHVEAALL